MSTRGRAAGLIVLSALSLTIAAMTATAQSPTPESAKPTPPTPKAKVPQDPTRQVPPFFGQVGLTIEQRESIYAIRAKHQAKLDDLQAQIVKLKADMVKECETVLTPTQVDLLTKRRAIDVERRRAEAAKAKAGKPADAATTDTGDRKKSDAS